MLGKWWTKKHLSEGRQAQNTPAQVSRRLSILLEMTLKKKKSSKEKSVGSGKEEAQKRVEDIVLTTSWSS